MQKPKRKRRIFRKIIILLIVLALVLWLGWKYLPYQLTAERQIRKALEAEGIKVNSLTVEKVSETEAVITNISLHDKPTLNIERLHVQYSLQDLLTSRFNANTMVNIEADNIFIDAKPYEARTEKLKLDATGNKGVWTGTAESIITVAGLPQEVPPLTVKADFNVGAEIIAGINISDSSKHYKAIMDIMIPQGEIGMMELKKAEMPWLGGSISTANVKVPLAMDKPIDVKLKLKDVDLAALLGMVAEGQVGGKGSINGSFPATYHPDGSVTLHDGVASAMSGGTLRLEPTLIPGDNPQIEFTRTTLENFHYTTFKISVSLDKEERSVINLALEGRNPDMGGERPVKLNINLDGDILPLVQQSLLPLNDFRQYLKDVKND